MARPRIYIFLLFVFVVSLSGCSTATRTYVDPWPGLFQPKETNKIGHKSKKERNKQLEKVRKERAKQRN